jgi:hypothetical protein
MSVEVDKTTITTFRGDTCEVTFTDLEEGMVIYFGVRDKKNNELVFEEIRGVVNSEGEVTFRITPEMCNNFVVKTSEGVNIYYYGIKEVDDVTGEENTILLGDNPRFSDKYQIKVYLKKVEGIIEE